MSFLKNLGKIIATVGAEAVGLGPLVAPLFGSKGGAVAQGLNTAANDLTLVGQIVAQIEVIAAATQGMTGAQKFAAALALVKPVILTSQIISGKKIADAALLDKAVGEITQGVVDLLNSVDGDSTKTEVQHT